MNIFCFLIPALVGLICALLGYLLGKLKSDGAKLKSNLAASIEENSKLSHKNSLLENDLLVAKLSLQNELDACKANSSKLSATVTLLQSELDLFNSKSKVSKNTTTEKTIKAAVTPKKAAVKKVVPAKKAPVKKASGIANFDVALAKEALGKRVKLDDLKIIEGIGPKIEELYQNAGIKTWKALSETPLEKLQAILDEAGDRYSIHNPGTWAKQALLAYQGKWTELKAWQDTLDGGKE